MTDLTKAPAIKNDLKSNLSTEDVRFIASAPRNSRFNVLNVHKNIAATESGFSSTVQNEWMQHELDSIRAHEQIIHHETKLANELGRAYQSGKCSLLRPNYFHEIQRGAQGEALKGLGSSKGAKVRHGRVTQNFIKRNRRLRCPHGAVRELSLTAVRELANDSLGAATAHPMQSGWVRNPDAVGNRVMYVPENRSSAYLMHQEWSGKYKVQVVYKPEPSDAPEANTGERYTEQLTSRAVRQIFESGAYVAALHGGFTTFLTLTFTPEQRDAIFSGDITLGNEVSRFLDAAKKVYQRGFQYSTGELENAKQTAIDACHDVINVDGHDDDFHYIWVAECPMNEDGEPNPHVHLLLNWQVEKQHFRAWAKRIESLWGHGLAHLERIKYGQAASGYLIKAVGYAAKGANADQGLIRGNRYNIARCSRAPAWDVLATFDVDNITGIIKECAYKLEQWRKPHARAIARKSAKKQEMISAAAIAERQGDANRKRKCLALIKRLEQEILETKAVLKSRGVFARSDSAFAICFEGENAEQSIDEFLQWAAGARNWSLQCHDQDMSDIKAQSSEYYQAQYHRFLERQASWRAQLTQELPPVLDEETMQQIISEHWSYYDEHNRTFTG